MWVSMHCIRNEFSVCCFCSYLSTSIRCEYNVKINIPIIERYVFVIVFFCFCFCLFVVAFIDNFLPLSTYSIISIVSCKLQTLRLAFQPFRNYSRGRYGKERNLSDSNFHVKWDRNFVLSSMFL